MNILALEFSSEQRSVAVLRDSRADIEPVQTAALANPRILNAFRLIEEALAKAGLAREQIECVAVGLGPGSYTGIRAAISVAQAWQLARGVRLLGISSVECLARQAQADGVKGRFSIIVDAQRNEFYLATFGIEGGQLRIIEPLKLAPSPEVVSRADAGEMLIGPDAVRFFPKAGAMFPAAEMLAKLAVGKSDFVPGEKLEPIYLRETSFVKAPPPRFSS